jgi:uncharacterized BrkB/YihY/UPF0761 family membrane protein
MGRRVWHLIRAAIDAFVRDEALTRGAAIAFYIATAIAPILYITVTIAGLLMGQDAARKAVADVLGRIMSHDSVAVLELATRNAGAPPRASSAARSERRRCSRSDNSCSATFSGPPASEHPRGGRRTLVLLVRACYMAQVFLLGAEATKVYACQYGSRQGCHALNGPAVRGTAS